MTHWKNCTAQLRRIHRYLGVFVGVLLFGLGLTGTVLAVYPPPQTSVVFQQSRQKSSVPLSIVDAWQISAKQDPSLAVKSINSPTMLRPYYRVHFHGKNASDLAISPQTGEVAALGRPQNSGWRAWLKHFHTDFWAGKAGKLILAMVGAMSIVLCISGAWLWSGWRKWRLGWQIRWQGKGIIPYFDFHQVSGMVSIVFVLGLCLTGTILAAKPVVKDFNVFWAREANATTVKVATTFQPSFRQINRWLANAEVSLPGGSITKIDIPKSRQKLARIHILMPGEVIFPNGRSWVDISVQTGAVAKIYNFAATAWLNVAWASLEPLHTGHFNRSWAPWLYGLSGLALASLAMTGFVIWYRKYYPAKRPLRPTVR
jgi:uncharacterized iron-regulated membrane protein